MLDEVRDTRSALPAGVHGEIWNGDEFGPGCGFGWDPLRPEFWKEMGLPKPSDSTIKSRFTRFANEVAAIWNDPTRTIRAASHVYLYPDFALKHRGAKVQPVVTECGVFSEYMDNPRSIIHLQNALLANGVTWAFWHQPWPGNPGDGKAFESGNLFMYDADEYKMWLNNRQSTWPEWDGAMLRGAAPTLEGVFRS
jgi:hypothetical protein